MGLRPGAPRGGGQIEWGSGESGGAENDEQRAERGGRAAWPPSAGDAPIVSSFVPLSSDSFSGPGGCCRRLKPI